MFDNDFMKSKEARLVRIVAEYLEAEEILKKNNIENTIVIFGSSRILPPNEAKKNIDLAKETFNKNPNDAESIKLLEKAENNYEISQYYDKASNLAFKFANWSKQFKDNKKYYICTGGGYGIMEAANKGAFEANEKTIGLNIHLPFEKGFNQYLDKDSVINFNYFFMRKFWFSYHAKAFIVFPGGFGTLDELFEMLTLVQTNKMKKKIPIVLFGENFFKKLINIELLEKYSLISETDKNLFLITNDVEEAFNYVVKNLANIN